MRLLLPAILFLCVHLPGISCFLTDRPALVPIHLASKSDGVLHAAAAPGTGSSLDEVKADTSDAQQPIRRVAIVGAGIAGLSLAHALESTCNDVEVTIFDSRPEPLDFGAGAGVQINGGASVLRRINPELHGKVVRAALPLKDIRSRAKPWFQSGGSNGNPFSTLLEINLESAIKNTGGDVEKALIVDGEVQAFTIMRGALQKLLLEALPSTTQVELGKRLTNIKSTDGGNGAVCTFNNDDDSFGPFDIVCGCDGIQSAVKQYVDSYKISSDKKSSQSALYSGIRIRYAIEDCDEVGDVAELRQYFGDGAYGLYGTYGAGEGETRKRGAYLIFNDKDYIGPFPKRKEESDAAGVETKAAAENAEWAESSIDMKADTLLRMKNAGLPDEELRPVIEAADKFFELGVYFHNPFSFRGWTRKVKGTKGTYACLLGDSAHAMPPFLGQGANQAIQDAYCLATKIAAHNTNCASGAVLQSPDGTEESKASTLEELLKEYETLRWSPTASITLKSILLGYLETGGEGLPSKLRDSVFFTLGKLGIARKVFLDGATPKF